MKIGQQVRVRAYGGEELVRRIVQVEDDFLVICREEEYLEAKRAGREPHGVGFSKEYVLGVVQQQETTPPGGEEV